jgi:hypothetical protein
MELNSFNGRCTDKMTFKSRSIIFNAYITLKKISLNYRILHTHLNYFGNLSNSRLRRVWRWLWTWTSSSSWLIMTLRAVNLCPSFLLTLNNLLNKHFLLDFTCFNLPRKNSWIFKFFGFEYLTRND